MAKRGRAPSPTSNSAAKPQGRQPRPGIVHSSVYLPVAIHEALREVAFRERLKIHDIILEGIEMALRNRDRRKRPRAWGRPSPGPGALMSSNCSRK